MFFDLRTVCQIQSIGEFGGKSCLKGIGESGEYFHSRGIRGKTSLQLPWGIRGIFSFKGNLGANIASTALGNQGNIFIQGEFWGKHRFNSLGELGEYFSFEGNFGEIFM